MSFIGFSELRSDERGVGLLFGLFAAAVVAAVAWTMVTTGLVDMTISDNYRNHSTAFYAADAGVEESLIDFKADQTWITQFVDLETAELLSQDDTTVAVNGFDIEVELDETGLIVPGYYPMGPATTIGDGTYQREVYLPPLVAVGDCTAQLDDGGANVSGSESGSDSGSSSNSGNSGTSGSSGGSAASGDVDVNDPCEVLDAILEDDSESDSGNSDDSGSDSFASLLSPGSAPTGLLLAPLGLAEIQETTVTICHVPPGNPDAAHTITIGAPAYAAHMAQHPDYDGECTDDGVPVDPVQGNAPLLLIVKVRSTGTASGDASTRILADLIFTVSTDNDILDIQVGNWREDH